MPIRSAMTSEFCDTAARRSRTGGYSSGAAGGSGGRPSSRPTVARSRYPGRKGIKEPKPILKPLPAHPCARRRSGWRARCPVGAGHDKRTVGHDVRRALQHHLVNAGGEAELVAAGVGDDCSGAGRDAERSIDTAPATVENDLDGAKRSLDPALDVLQ